jgi:O-antigen biosynthesis protein WbqP
VTKRLFDFTASFVAIIVLLIPSLIIWCLVKWTSPGSGLFWSKRIGRNNISFEMPKFRTMLDQTPVVATDALANASNWLTPVGGFLRKSSLDEIPQLWCVLIGKMSLVGPRPALQSQTELIAMRTKHGVERIRPGITGWAQVNGRDHLTVSEKVDFDTQYLARRSLAFDLRILWTTLYKVIRQAGISH